MFHAHRTAMLMDPTISRLRRARLELGWTLEDLAEAIYVDKSMLGRYEVRNLPVPRRSQALLSRALGIPEHELFGPDRRAL
jgi:transcriptional regulator with XRE-family HTH domain